MEPGRWCIEIRGASLNIQHAQIFLTFAKKYSLSFFLKHVALWCHFKLTWVHGHSILLRACVMLNDNCCLRVRRQLGLPVTLAD